MTDIRVIDALMGTGKTQYVYNLLRSNPDQPYLYIGVTLEESRKCREALPALDMKEPEVRKGGKYWDLEWLIDHRHNIASTHALFRLLKVPLYEKLQLHNYTLVIDEVLDVVHLYDGLTRDDERMLRESERIFVDDKYCLRWNHAAFPKYDGRFNELVRLCDNGNLVSTREGIVMWTFPAQLLSAFKAVYICSYLFEGQDMAAYLRANNVTYRLLTLKDGALVDYATVDNQVQKERLGQLITIDDSDHRNKVGKRTGKGWPLSEGWFARATSKAATAQERVQLKQLKNSIERFFKEVARTPAWQNMWTSFKKYRPKLKGMRYSKGFVPINAKATNEYQEKAALAYVADRQHNPLVTGYFHDMGVEIGPNRFALTELLQWVWRSRIRKQQPEPINLFIPSERMRTILVNWMRYSDRDIIANDQLLYSKGAN